MMRNDRISRSASYNECVSAAINLDALISETAAAARLGVSHITLIRWRRKRSGPRHVRMGEHSIRYHPSDLAAWIERRTSKDASPCASS